MIVMLQPSDPKKKKKKIVLFIRLILWMKQNKTKKKKKNNNNYDLRYRNGCLIAFIHGFQAFPTFGRSILHLTFNDDDDILEKVIFSYIDQ